MEFETPEEDANRARTSVAPAPEASDSSESFETPATDQQSAVKSAASDPEFNHEVYAAQNPDKMDFAYEVDKARDARTMGQKIAGLQYGKAAAGVWPSLVHFVSGLPSLAKNLAQEAYYGATGDKRLQTKRAELAVDAQNAEQGGRELVEGTAGKLMNAFTPVGDPEEASWSGNEGAADYLQQEQERRNRKDFDRRVANAKTNLSLSAGRPVETGMVASAIRNTGMQQSISDLYSPEALAANGAPPVDLEAIQNVSAFANPVNLALGLAPSIPGASYLGGRLTQGAGKLLQAPMAVMEAVPGRIGRTASSIAGPAAGVVIGEQAIHNPILAAKIAAGAVAAKGLQKIGQAMESQGAEAATGVPSDLSSRVATGRFEAARGTGSIDKAAELGRVVGNAPVNAASTAIGMIPANAAISDGDPQKFLEASASAAVFGGSLGMLHGQRPMLVEALRPELRSEGIRTMDTESDLGQKSAAYLMSQPEEVRDRAFEAMGSLQGLVTKSKAGEEGYSQFYVVDAPTYQAELQKLHGPTASDGGRGFFTDSSGHAIINGDAQGGAGDLSHTMGHEGAHMAAAIMRAGGSKGSALWDGMMDKVSGELLKNGKPTKDFQEFIDTYNQAFDPTGKTKRLDASNPDAVEEFMAEHAGRILAGEGNDFALPKTIFDRIEGAVGRFAAGALGLDKSIGQTSPLNRVESRKVTEMLRDTLAQIAQRPRDARPAGQPEAEEAAPAPQPVPQPAPEPAQSSPEEVNRAAAFKVVGLDSAEVDAAREKASREAVDAERLRRGKRPMSDKSANDVAEAGGRDFDEQLQRYVDRLQSDDITHQDFAKTVAKMGGVQREGGSSLLEAIAANELGAGSARPTVPAPVPVEAGLGQLASVPVEPAVEPAQTGSAPQLESFGQAPSPEIKPRVRIARDEAGNWFERPQEGAPEGTGAGSSRPATPSEGASGVHLPPEELSRRVEAAENEAKAAEAAKKRKTPESREKATAQAVKEARIKALLDAAHETAPDASHLQRREENGATKYTGRIDESIPAHRALLDELGVDKGARSNIATLQDNLGKVVFVDYKSAAKEGQSEGAGLDVTGKQRAKEYKAESVGARIEDAKAGDKNVGVEQTKAFYPMGFKVNPSTGSVTATGFSPNRLLSNVGKIIDFLRAEKRATGYESAQDPEIIKDFNGLAQNHANGYKGDGSGPLAGETPTPGYEPYAIDGTRFELLNAAMANESAKTPKTNRGDAKANAEAAQQTARDNGGFVTEEGETNQLRDFINQSGRFTYQNEGGETRSGTKEILEPTIESLRVDPELMRKISTEAPEGEMSLRPSGVIDPSALTASGIPKSKPTAAGFMPGQREGQLGDFGKEERETSIKSKIDEAAKAAGYTIPAAHSTNAGPFTIFKTDNLGAHFGTEKAAEDRANHLREFSENVVGRDHKEARIMPLYLKIENPLRLPDLAELHQKENGEIVDLHEARDEWHERYSDLSKEDQDRYNEGYEVRGLGDEPRPMAWESDTDFAEVLRDNDIISQDEFWDVQYDPQAAVELLKENGYDGIVYKNGVEDIGNDSHIVFDPSQVKSAEEFTRDDGGEEIPLHRRFDSSSDDIRFMPGQGKQLEDFGAQDEHGFYSGLQRAIKAKIPNRASGEQILATLKGAGVKQEEMDNMGLAEFLKTHEGPVSKEKLQEFVKAGGVEFKEVTKSESKEGVWNVRENSDGEFEVLNPSGEVDETFSDAEEADTHADSMQGNREGIVDNTKFSQYQLPGGENYKEVLMTLPGGKKSSDAIFQKEHGMTEKEFRESYGEAQTNLFLQEHQAQGRTDEFRSSHWDEPNVLVHTRQADHVDTEGNRVRLIEEIQSDWHQAGRKSGYDTGSLSDSDVQRFHDISNEVWGNTTARERAEMRAEAEQFQKKGGVPDAPFKKTWAELAFKRALRMAAEDGMDKIAWTPGEIQAERYSLRKQVDEIQYSDAGDGEYEIWAIKDGRKVIQPTIYPADKLEGVVGKDVARRIVNGDGEDSNPDSGHEYKSLSGENLAVGGEGMKGFYDKILPDFVRKYVKKWGGKVETTELDTQKDKSASGKFYVDEGRNGFIVRDSNTDGEIKFFSEREAAENFANNGSTREMVHSVTITPEMRKAIMEEGQPMFMPGGESGKAQEKEPSIESKVDLDGLKWAQPKRATNAGDVVVNVKVSDFDKAFQKDHGFYIDDQGNGEIKGRRERFQEFLKEGKPVEMPEVVITKDGAAAFVNGRHRFSVIRDGGAETIPVSMDEQSALRAHTLGMVADQTKGQLSDFMPGDYSGVSKTEVKEGAADEQKARRARLMADMQAQSSWLTDRAKEKGFKSVDDLSEEDPATFGAMAKQWREEHPRFDTAGNQLFMPGRLDANHRLEDEKFYKGMKNPVIHDGLPDDPNESIARHNAKVEILNKLEDEGALTTDAMEMVKDWDDGVESYLFEIGEKRYLSEIESEHEGDSKKEQWGASMPLFDWVKQAHPETSNIKLAGYVLPEGEMLNFSHDGRHRDQDHREVTWPGSSGHTEKLIAMMNAGAMRIDANSGNISLRRSPTGAQEKAILKIVDAAGTAYVDAEIPGEDGFREAKTKDFEIGEDNADSQLKKLRNFFRASYMPGDEGPKRTWFERGGRRVYHHRGEAGKFASKPDLANFGRAAISPKKDDDAQAQLSSFE